MSLVYSLVLFLFGVFIYYYKNGAYFFHFFFLWITIAPVLYSIPCDMDMDDYWTILAWASKLGDFALLDTLIRIGTKIEKPLKGILMCLIVAMSYVVFLIIIRNLPTVQYIKYGLESFSIIAGVSMFYRRQIEFRSLHKLLKIGFVFELFVGLIQVFYQPLNYNCALSGNEVLFVNGTFLGNNTYIEFLTCLGFMLYYLEYKKRGKLSLTSLVTGGILAYLTYETGVRMALVAMLIPYGYFIYIFLKKKRQKHSAIIYIVISLIIAIPILSSIKSFVSNSDVTYTRDATSVADRQAVMASIFLDNTYLIEHTTLGLSYSIVTSLPNNPVMGPGLYFTKKGYNGYSYIEGSSITDATLALFIGEFGIIGLLFIGYMLKLILYKINLKRRGALVIAFYLIVVSLTDNGIFGAVNLFTLVTMIALEKRFEITPVSSK